MKMKFFILLLGLLTVSETYGQVTFTIDNFSDDYYGKLYIKDTTEVFSEGWVAIYNKKTKKQLIKVESEELTFTLHDGKVKANIQELPYGEQSSIIYADFNFDGKKDFALMDGQFSCYHGPSFQVYLASGNGFKYDIEFSRLAHEYCGMFNVDYETKTISTMTKSGCCWHEYSDFKVENNFPVEVKVVEEGLNPMIGFIWDYVEKNRVNGKMVEKKYSLFDTEMGRENTFYSFEFSNEKKMRLVVNEAGNNVYYVFTDKNNIVEMLYMDEFRYSKQENAIWFENAQKTTYKITSTGIIVTLKNGKVINMQAKPGTIKGSLNKLKNTRFQNVK